MDALLFALLAGALAGGSNVATRIGLRRAPDVEAAALTMTVASLLVAIIAAAATTRQPAAWEELWPYLVVGVFAPGLVSIIFVWGVREAGPSRTAVLINTFPLFAAALAIVFLDEPLRLGLALGTLVVVVGAIGIARAGDVPADIRGTAFRLALVATVAGALIIGARDTAVRWASEGQEISALVAATATLLSGSGTILLYLVLKRGGLSPLVRVRRAVGPFGAIGVLIGANTLLIFEALERGRVTVVSPLIGTASLWTLVFSVVVLGRSEALSKRVIAAAIVVAAGVALIGVTRGSGS